MRKKGSWNKRPKGCERTISGMHTPEERHPSTSTIEFYCSSCGKIDDTLKFSEWLGYGKIDDWEEQK